MATVDLNGYRQADIGAWKSLANQPWSNVDVVAELLEPAALEKLLRVAKLDDLGHAPELGLGDLRLIMDPLEEAIVLEGLLDDRVTESETSVGSALLLTAVVTAARAREESPRSRQAVSPGGENPGCQLA